MKKLAIIAILLFLSLNLTSCINITRNIKVNKDGSGSENMMLEFDKTFFDIMVSFATMGDSTNANAIRDSLYDDEDFISGIKEKLIGVPGLTLENIYSVTNADSSKTIFASYAFDNVDKLGISISDDSDQLLSEKIEVKYTDRGDDILFTYTELEDPEDVNGQDSTYTAIIDGIAELFKGKQAVYSFEFDYDVISSNATTQDGRKLTWIVPLDEKMRNREKLHLEAILQK
ncbi:MAG: hypothetical protein KDC73_04030 [Ignavibacteriae bacterium]|nr:hypothetical protein [Ignavibacteriota bacterium]MCB9244111.1 hypothetical protein [Ignavibacteriales bacterium]